LYSIVEVDLTSMVKADDAAEVEAHLLWAVENVGTMKTISGLVECETDGMPNT
jgi:hypothetical protein